MASQSVLLYSLNPSLDPSWSELRGKFICFKDPF